MPLKSVLHPAKIGLILGIIALYLAAQSLFNEYLSSNVLHSDTHLTAILVLDLFSVNVEASIPTWYSVLLLFGAAVLLGMVAKAKWETKDRFKYHWATLALIFIYLSMDEGAAIHEIVADPLQALFHTTGYLAFAWQIVAVPLVILFVGLYLPFVFHLPARWRYLFIASGVVYLTGALVVEAISANRWYLEGGITFTYLAIATVEELFEMLGVVLLIYTLLAYMQAHQLALALTFTAVEKVANVDGSPQALANPTPPGAPPLPWKRLGLLLLGGLLCINGVVYFWATTTQTGSASPGPTAPPFYQKVLEQYSGQGVIVLQLNGVFTASNPSTQPTATSLLVLFEEVLVVSLPSDNLSVAFVGATLPFGKADLEAILRANGNADFVILDTQEISTFTQSDNLYLNP